ncbi:MAG: hypothetical protein COX06_02770 [Candidatus Zambryskibacteria bacterium CG22_combo_CG10-13_8_21_14_all_42_17]|uniref:Uncharacterized protein n=1 Tax=Candidatus Zambryskibacteria bacterium CG22_combo_CG10-13_8_21_14_all_42_17 TaxID=1975118 RepID=A0A2H0BCZ5_9BACT|nr:MAG: hypothetical protein COX06_02770 [Candidatus Zambryskibacteria bacterium CG22_combo_CG10-13_8_21_14_all_42_17]
MKKILLAVVAIILLFALYLAYIAQQKTTRDTDNELSVYFQNRLDTLGVEEGLGRPIEGFDAGLLIGAFPGLLEEDFDSVETFEGHYKFDNGEFSFDRNFGGSVSSAERTVSEEGYETLLKNVAQRLRLEVNSEADIDSIIETINTADIVSVRIGESIEEIFGVQISPLEIIEDSRCPSDVECIQMGTVRVSARVVDNNESITQTLELREPISTPSATITLVMVEPQPVSNVDLEDSDYVFYFEVEKENNI